MVYLDFEKPIVELEQKLEEFRKQAIARSLDLTNSIQTVQREIENRLEEIYSNLTPYQTVQVARHVGPCKVYDPGLHNAPW